MSYLPAHGVMQKRCQEAGNNKKARGHPRRDTCSHEKVQGFMPQFIVIF